MLPPSIESVPTGSAVSSLRICAKQGPTGARRRSLPPLLLAAVAVLPYLNSLHGDFVFDDIFVIRDNPNVQQGALRALFTEVHHPGAYRPLTMLTYAANARVSNDPFAYHLANVALHAAVTLAAFALARRLLASQTAAAIAALLFAVHPCHTEAVASIVGRAELLAAWFVLLSLLSFGRAVTGQAWGATLWWAASLLAFCAGLLSKESAFTAIALVPAMHWCLLPRAPLRQRFQVIVPYAAVGLAYLALRAAVVGSVGLPAPPELLDNPLAHVSLTVRLATAWVVLGEYAALLIMPLQLAADYSFNAVPLVLSPFDPRLLLTAATFCGLAVVVAASSSRVPGLGVSAWFAVAPLALTANVLFPIGTIKAERLLYLPSLGCCLAGGTLALRAFGRSPRVWTVVLLLVIVTFAGRTWARNYDWRSNSSLFETTAASSWGSAKAHYNLAVARQQDGRLDEALAHYRRAFDIYPAYASAAFGIGRIYELRGNDAAALHWYEEALRRDWQLAEVHFNVGRIHQRQHRLSCAEAAFRSGLASAPANPLLLAGLSLIRLSQGDPWEALSLLDAMNRVPIAPDKLAVVAALRHRIEEAVR